MAQKKSKQKPLLQKVIVNEYLRKCSSVDNTDQLGDLSQAVFILALVQSNLFVLQRHSTLEIRDRLLIEAVRVRGSISGVSSVAISQLLASLQRTHARVSL